MPDIKFKTKDEIPETLREYAKEKDDGFVVGVVHESFRDTNIAVKRERDEWKGKFEKVAPLIGEDLEKFSTELTELRTTAQQVKDGKLTKKDDIDREVANRVKAEMDKVGGRLTEAERALVAEKTRGDAFEGKYKGMVVDQAIIAAVTSADSGANPAALPDILNRARAVFAAGDDGALVAMKDGQKWYADGDRTISPKEWLAQLLKDAPYLGNASNGTGGAGGKQGAGKLGMSEEAFNKLPPAERMRIARQKGIA